MWQMDNVIKFASKGGEILVGFKGSPISIFYKLLILLAIFCFLASFWVSPIVCFITFTTIFCVFSLFFIYFFARNPLLFLDYKTFYQIHKLHYGNGETGLIESTENLKLSQPISIEVANKKKEVKSR